MSRNRPQKETPGRHPDEYQNDLNPNAMAGQNIGTSPTEPPNSARTAYDLKPLHARLNHLLDNDLKQIRVLDEGSRLQQGAVYFDLKHPERGEIRATGDLVAGPDNWYVPKEGTHYTLWNLLIGVDNPDRLGTTRE